MVIEAPIRRSVAKTSDSKIDSIQVLRGIAALIVTIFHLKELARKDPPFNHVLDFFFNNGPAGVNLFFIISGFIMVYITRRSSYSVKDISNFLIKRLIRIWPTYLIITLLYVFLVWGRNFYSQMDSIVNSLLFIPLTSTDAPFYGYSILPVGWSLNYEIYFYLLIAVSMIFLKYRWTVFFIIIFVTLIAIPLYFGSFTLNAENEYNYGNRYLNLITNPIMWNFVYGIIIGRLFLNKRHFNFLSGIFSIPWIFYSALAFSVWQYLSGFFGGAGPLQWGLGSSILFMAFVFYKSKIPQLFPASLIHLGNMSFSIYLLHLPVQRIIERIFNVLHVPIYSTGISALFLSVCMTLILSHLSYKYLEVKLSNFIKGMFLKSQAA